MIFPKSFIVKTMAMSPVVSVTIAVTGWIIYVGGMVCSLADHAY